VNPLIVAALLLEAAVLCAARLERAAPRREAARDAVEPRKDGPRAGMGGGALSGISLLLRSPYLAGIAGWVFLLSLAGTFLYFQQANIVRAASDDPAVRTRIFAVIDLAVGLLTVLVQCAATGRLIVRFGVGRAAAFLPLVFGIGFAVLAASPALLVVIGFQAIQRTANFAISNPAREILFTVVDREEKYKAKNVVDTVVFRASDAITGWLFATLRAAGLELTSISAIAVAAAGLWLVLALTLGRAHARRARAAAAPSSDRAIATG
jgi:AAA family ATP:ADP antiporter